MQHLIFTIVFLYKNILLEDGATKVFVNTKGVKGNISPELRDVMNLFNNHPVKREFVKKLGDEVERIKQNKEWGC